MGGGGAEAPERSKIRELTFSSEALPLAEFSLLGNSVSSL